jgi:hypothetical protein
MYVQLDLKEDPKDANHQKITFDFHEFWGKELHYEKMTKKTLDV